MPLTYHPDVFRVNDLAAAMKVILTDEDTSSQERWKNETPYLAELIIGLMDIRRDSLWLDYGCGIGRLSKELIERCGCHVIGLDISPQMRALAPVDVESDRFFACSPSMLDRLIASGVGFDGALAVWVLQHCFKPADDIALIRRALKPDARLFVLNNFHRAIPTREEGWVNDGFDVRSLLHSELTPLQEGTPSLDHMTPLTVKNTFWATFGNRA